MPYAPTHILVPIVLVELFREWFVKDNKKFPRYYIFLVAIGGIIPDLDIAGFYVLSFFGFTLEQIHRTFFHSIFIPLILLLLGIFFWKFQINNKHFAKRHMTLPAVFFILSFGAFMHLLLDFIVVGKIMPFYPFSDYSVGLDLITIFPLAWKETILGSIDAALIIFWIAWLQFKLKVSDYF